MGKNAGSELSWHKPGMSQLELKQLQISFGLTTAVEPTDLIIRSGELTALLGPSGCGKTTLLRMIAGLESPSSGIVLLDGENITALPAHKRKFGMVFIQTAESNSVEKDQTNFQQLSLLTLTSPNF